MKFVVTYVLLSLIGSGALASTDHTFYYKGTLHITDLTSGADGLSCQLFVLKKDILPSKSQFVETATMLDYKGIMSDLTTIVDVKGNTVVAKSKDGTAIGTGMIQGVGPDGDFTYLNMTFVIVPSGISVKNINYITPNKLIARKEISNSIGVATALWESDMDLISEGEYQNLRDQLYKRN